ncbi:MAG: hypothetical protein ACRDE2_16055 [Chitinophagaceae bacterium]
MKIDIHNYEEFMLNFVDEELNEEEAKSLLRFLDEHSELQAELKLLQATKLPEREKILFPDKNSLYKKEDIPTQKVYFFSRHPWLSVAAACLLLLVALVVHPWKKQIMHIETAVNIPPVQDNKSSLPANVNPSSEQTIHKQRAEQKSDLAVRQAKKSAAIHRFKVKENNFTPLVKLASISKPELPVMLAEITSPVNKINSISLNEKDLPKETPIDYTAPMVQVAQINIIKNNELKNNEMLATSNKQGGSEDLIQKVDEWKNKPSEILGNIHHNGLKIGKLTFAFNN